MSEVVLYGIKNCDTIKKARKWLREHAVDYRFHDYRADGCDPQQLAQWCEQVGWEILLNRRGTTWRKLPESEKDEVNEQRAIELMTAQPAMIKRPVLVTGDKLLVGFVAAEYKTMLL